MAKTVVGSFDSFDEARRVVDALESVGFSSLDINLIANDAGGRYRGTGGSDASQGGSGTSGTPALHGDRVSGHSGGLAGDMAGRGPVTGISTGASRGSDLAGDGQPMGLQGVSDRDSAFGLDRPADEIPSAGTRHADDAPRPASTTSRSSSSTTGGIHGTSTSSGDVAAGAGSGAVAGGVIGGAAGLMAGLAGLAIPGVGPLVAAGPIVAALAGAGVGAVAGGLIGALRNVGVNDEDAEYYAEAVRRGGALVAVKAEDHRAQDAADIMREHGAIDIESRVSQWRAAGWSRFDPDAQPYSHEQIQGDRNARIDSGVAGAMGGGAATPRRVAGSGSGATLSSTMAAGTASTLGSTGGSASFEASMGSTDPTGTGQSSGPLGSSATGVDMGTSSGSDRSGNSGANGPEYGGRAATGTNTPMTGSATGGTAMPGSAAGSPGNTRSAAANPATTELPTPPSTDGSWLPGDNVTLVSTHTAGRESTASTGAASTAASAAATGSGPAHATTPSAADRTATPMGTTADSMGAMTGNTLQPDNPSGVNAGSVAATDAMYGTMPSDRSPAQQRGVHGGGTMEGGGDVGPRGDTALTQSVSTSLGGGRTGSGTGTLGGALGASGAGPTETSDRMRGKEGSNSAGAAGGFGGPGGSGGSHPGGGDGSAGGMGTGMSGSGMQGASGTLSGTMVTGQAQAGSGSSATPAGSGGVGVRRETRETNREQNVEDEHAYAAGKRDAARSGGRETLGDKIERAVPGDSDRDGK